jgi:hypothetical protein
MLKEPAPWVALPQPLACTIEPWRTPLAVFNRFMTRFVALGGDASSVNFADFRKC